MNPDLESRHNLSCTSAATLSEDMKEGSFLEVGWEVQDRVSVCSPSSPETHSVDQDGLELRDLSVSLPSVLR